MLTGTQDGKDLVFGTVEGLLSDVNELAPNLRLWVDTCHGGACLKYAPPTMCIGATCGIMSKAPMGPEMRKIFVDLLCDAKKGCEKWKKVDTNGDGKIDAQELNEHLSKVVGENKEEVTDIVSKEQADALATELKQKTGGKITSNQLAGYPINIHYKKVEVGSSAAPEEITTSLYMLGQRTSTNDRISLTSIPSGDLFNYLAVDKEKAEAELRRIFPSWPNCGEYGGTKKRFRLEDCSVEMGSEAFYKVSYEYTTIKGRKTDGVSRPLTNTFSLAAKQCATTEAATPHGVGTTDMPAMNSKTHVPDTGADSP